MPGFELRVVERGQVVLRSRVIVGGKDNETPIFDDRIRYVEVNPSWYVPTSIVPELLEKEAKRPGYLAGSGFQWRGSSEPGARQTLVQKPGPDNALGRIKFLFPNEHAVYLHDTPQPKLFGRSQRNLSHGCVRVEKPNELALALLGDQGWDMGRLDRAPTGSRKTQRIDARRSRCRCSSTTAPPSSTTRAGSTCGPTCTASTGTGSPSSRTRACGRSRSRSPSRCR